MIVNTDTGMTRILTINNCTDCPHSQHDIRCSTDDGMATGGITVGGWCWHGISHDADNPEPPTLDAADFVSCPPDSCPLPIKPRPKSGWQ